MGGVLPTPPAVRDYAGCGVVLALLFYRILMHARQCSSHRSESDLSPAAPRVQNKMEVAAPIPQKGEMQLISLVFLIASVTVSPSPVHDM